MGDLQREFGYVIEMESTPKSPLAPHGHYSDDFALDTLDKVETPKLFKVMLLNDDYTPMDFVILVLQRFFGKSEETATAIMLDVHKKGAGVAGVYTLEIAEMRVMQVHQFARSNQYPLKATIEEAES